MSSKERTEPPPTDVETNFKDVEDSIEKTSSSKKAKTESTASPYFTLFVGQIPYETTAEDLTEFFTKEAKLRGDIKVRLLTNKSTGGSRGMAFLQVEDLTEFDRCLLLNNKLIKGRRINVERSCIKKA
jgi:RNA recognition motif-containing protein